MSHRILVTPRSLTAAPGDSLAELEAAGFELVFSPRVIAAPHIGGFTAMGGREAARLAAANLIACLTQPNAAAGVAR